MRVTASLSLSLALAQMLHLTLAIPTMQSSTSSLVPRSPMCFNAPGIRAGTYLTRRAGEDGTPPPPRPPTRRPVASGSNLDDHTVWCQARSSTYLTASWMYPLPGISWLTAQSVLAIAIALVHETIQRGHDGPVATGSFHYGISDVLVYVANTNNHQITLGVLGAALTALSEYFTHLQDTLGFAPGRVEFIVVDGNNEVGRGYFDTDPRPAPPPFGD